jgi:GYF domain 2
MPDLWYYADQNGSVGPLTLQELLETLATLPNASDVLVWCDKFSDWKRAGDVAELRAQIVVPPPLLPKNQPSLRPRIPPLLMAPWMSMKRGFLFGLTSFLVVGAIGALVRGGFGIGAGLLFLAGSAAAVQAARKAPPNKSKVYAIVGWLIGFFVIDVVALVIFGAMWLFT